MGTGKTTLGRALALNLDVSFCDLDQYIEQRYMKSIRQIFSEKGEDEFRRIEAGLLREVGEFEDVIVSCGGSTPLFHDNMDYMKMQGDTVWLDSSESVLFRRLKVARSMRPLIASKNDEELLEYIRQECVRRNPYYAQAMYRYSGDNLESVSQIAESVAGIRKLLNV